MGIPRLLPPERDHRLDADGAARLYSAGGERDEEEHARNDQEGQRVARADAEGEWRQHLRQRSAALAIPILSPMAAIFVLLANTMP